MKFDHSYPLSWSSINMFDSESPWCDREEWYRTYALKLPRKAPSKEMLFGTYVDLKIQNDPTFLPELIRLPHLQYELKAVMKEKKEKDIKLYGKPDNLCLETFQLEDFKTGKGAWTQKKAEETGQLKMYLLMLWLTHGIDPEKFTCRIKWMPTQENGDFTISFKQPFKIHTFHTKYTRAEILNFGNKIKKIRQEMIQYCIAKEKGLC